MNLRRILTGCASVAGRVVLLAIPTVFAAVYLGGQFPPLVREWRAMQFPLTPGTVVTSEANPPPRGFWHEWDLAYTYTVDGQTYTGTRYDYTGNNKFYQQEADRHAAAFPPGTAVEVAYNPADPADAALCPRRPGRMFERAALALVVLAVATVYFWVILFKWHPVNRPLPRRFDPANPRHVERTREGLVVRLPPEPLVLPGVGIITGALLALLITRVRPSPPDPYPWWAGFLIVVAAPGLIVALFALGRLPTLFVNQYRRKLVFRPGWPWREESLAFGDVADARVTRRTYQAKGGPVTCYQATLSVRSPIGAQDLVLCEYANEADANALAAWLREKLEVAPDEIRYPPG